MKRWMRAPATLAVAALLGGCAESMAFRQDDRVEILAPEQRSTVTAPVTVRWTARDVDVDGEPPTYALFVDRAPVKPGASLESLGDDACEALPGCPDEAFLNRLGVYTTRKTTFDIPVLGDTRTSRRQKKASHEVTIVLLDEHGRRRGEAAFFVEFTSPVKEGL